MLILNIRMIQKNILFIMGFRFGIIIKSLQNQENNRK